MVINVNDLVQEFRDSDFQAYVNSNPNSDLQYRSFFPTLFRTDLTFGGIESETGAKVVAPIVSLDSNVELKGRELLQSVRGEIPKIEVGRKMTERDFFRLNRLRNAIQQNPNNSAIKHQMFSEMYQDGRFVVDSVNARLELMAKQLLSTGKYNAKGALIDFKVKSVNADQDWTTSKASQFDPIAQIKKVQKEAEAKGHRYGYMTMSQNTFDSMLKAESVTKFTATFSQIALGLQAEPTLEQLNSALKGRGLPQVVIWDSFVNEESKAGKLTATTGWEEGAIHFSVTRDFGNTQYTISPEASIHLDETSKFTTDDFILVSVLGQAKPMSVVTVGMAFATPVLNNVSQKLILKTKL